MQIAKHYPNLDEKEKQWLVQSAALRPDANVEDFIDSFLALFPERAIHEGVTAAEIRKILTSRFNDILYRKERGYVQTIAEKRTEYQQTFSAVFAVLNPLPLLNYYEQIFTSQKSKPSDKFKAIQAAETLNKRIVQEEINRQQTAQRKALKTCRKKLFYTLNRKRFHAVYDNLDKALQAEIGKYDTNKMIEVLERQGMVEELTTLMKEIPFKTFEKLDDAAMDELYDLYTSKMIQEMPFVEYHELILSYLDPLERAMIEASNQAQIQASQKDLNPP